MTVVIIVVALISACAYFEKPAVSSAQRLIDEQAFIEQRQSSAQQSPPLPIAALSQRRIRLLGESSATPQPQNTVIESPPISLRMTNVPLRIFSSAMSDLIGYNIVIAGDVDSVVNQRLNRVGWREALHTIAELQGLVVDEQPDKRLIRLYKATAEMQNAGRRNNAIFAKQSRVELFRLRHADADKIATLLKSILGEQRKKGNNDGVDTSAQSSVVSDKSSHSLIVQGDKQTMELAAALIATIDVPQRQVMIEAFIVEAGDDFTRALGARLGKQRNGLFATDNINGPYLNLPVANGSGGLGLTFGSARIRVELSALEKAGKSRLISNPKIFTLDNQSAMIFEGSEVPYQTISDNGTQTEFKQAGLKLAVTPSIVNEQHLMLDLAINKDTVDTRLQNPPITRRELTSRLLVRSGDVVVIGGIYLNEQVRAYQGLPFITHLPLIGKWLQHRRREGDVKELMVFIAPQIV
ncbi:MAG: hypothetical protein GDA45_06095 [Chromatiales bacterium]|nr:hypothetical protein [Chromatiales bacterium]